MRVLDPEKGKNDFARYYLTGSSRISRTAWPPGTTQTPHKHLLIQESTIVHVGEIEIYHSGTWRTLSEPKGVVFDINEYHNTRTRSNAAPILFPNVQTILAALTSTEKVIPPVLDLHRDEIELVLRHDFFREGFEEHPDDPLFWSQGLAKNPALSKKFWEIVDRNKDRVSTLQMGTSPKRMSTSVT